MTAHTPPSFEDNSLSKADRRRLRRASKQAKDTSPSAVEPRNEKQAALLAHYQEGHSVFALGAAGTGKTYLSARTAARMLIDGKVEKIIIARVTVSEKKHQLGFLPGKLEQKLGPWLTPILDALKCEMSAAQIDTLRQQGQIEFASFEHMRGRTFQNAFVILDEAQNASFNDLRLFLTRIGTDSIVAVCGDLDQYDVEDSGLADVVCMGLDNDVPMEVVIFDENDVVRSEFARHWVRAFKNVDIAKNRDRTAGIVDRLSGYDVGLPTFIRGEVA